MQMRSSRTAGRAHFADDVAILDVLSNVHVDRREMAVTRDEAWP